MIKKVIKFIGIIGLLSQLACNFPKSDNNSSQSNDWTKDYWGCLNLRNEKLAKELVKQYDLDNKSQERFLKVFGNPNEKAKKEDFEILIYYFNSICDKNKPTKDSDKCFAKFYFESNKLKLTDFECE